MGGNYGWDIHQINMEYHAAVQINTFLPRSYLHLENIEMRTFPRIINHNDKNKKKCYTVIII